MSLDHLASQLSLSKEDICGLLSELILEEKIHGQIDQLNGFLEITKKAGETVNRHSELRRWAASLSQVNSQLLKKLQTNAISDRA